MKQAIVKIKGVSPFQQGKYHTAEALPKESKDDYEKRTWREKAHYDKNGMMFIPPMAFKKSLETSAKYLSLSTGVGKNLFTKHFVSGTMVVEGMPLNVHKDDVEGVWVMGNSRGQRGASGPRVLKCFPTIQEWSGTVTYFILDDIITEEVFTKVVKESGSLIGVGVFRPENGGYYGRFEVESIEWKVIS